MEENIFVEISSAIVAFLVQDKLATHGEDKNELMESFWCKVENMQLYGKDNTKQEWASMINEIKTNSTEINQKVVKNILMCFDDPWKWHFLVALNIEICKKHIKNHPEDKRVNNFAQTWKKIVEALFSVINTLQYFSIVNRKNKITSTIQLCLKQIKVNLCFFVTAIENGAKMAQNYASQCLLACLNQLQKEIFSKEEISCNEFIDLMDSAICSLDMLVEGSWATEDNNMDDLKKVVDELLCHAMTTAHVATDDAIKAGILSKAQGILRDIKLLKEALEVEENNSVIWTARCLGDALCGLERLVNSAVLKLFLIVELSMETPVKELVKICQSDYQSLQSEFIRKVADLDDKVTSFDVHLDRIMQIGSFAISCSSSIKKAVELKSCLASFESLEAELVPCATAMYMNPSPEHKRDFRLLVNHWLQESTKFRNLLDTIIDPAAYTDVVKDFLGVCLKELEADNSEKHDFLLKMVKAARTLDGVIQVSIQLDTTSSSEFSQIYDQVTQATVKCENLGRRLQNNDAVTRHKKIFKYASNLVETVQNLLCYQASKVLSNQSNDFADEVPNPPHAFSAKKNFYKLCVSDVEMSSEDTDNLAAHMAEGERLAKKSVLYNTPKRSTKQAMRTPLLKSVLRQGGCSTIARSRHRFSVQRKCTDKKELSDMELTLLLEDLKGTEGTFSEDQTLLPGKDFQSRNLMDLFSDWSSLIDDSAERVTCNVTEGVNQTPDSNHVDTFERINDLQQLEEKIKHLKT